jgi:hypothetical protein
VTEVAAIFPAHIELVIPATKAWATLTRFSLLAVPAWEIRAKDMSYPFHLTHPDSTSPTPK